ncbi:MAG: C-GCAxxG-C-C family protein [Anaerolineales bacterium]
MEETKITADHAYQLAYRYEQTREHCAQATLVAILESLGEVDESLIQAADGLTGGTALSSQGTCGALAAGILAISRLTGRSYLNFKNDQPGHSWAEVTALSDRFQEHYGGLTGKAVQSHLFGQVYSLRNQQERELFNRAGAHVDKCPAVCGNVARWTVEILLERAGQK